MLPGGNVQRRVAVIAAAVVAVLVVVVMGARVDDAAVDAAVGDFRRPLGPIGEAP